MIVPITITNVDRHGKAGKKWHIKVGNRWNTFTKAKWAREGIAWINQQIEQYGKRGRQG